MKASRRGPVSVVEPVDQGTAALVPDRDRPEGWTLLVEGVPQSHVDLGDPTYLEFEYMRRIASVIDAAGPAGSPLRVLHLGGGALTLPRYLEATRPRSHQRVVERDAALIALVRRVLPLPRGADLRVRVADARAAVEGTRDAAFDLVIADVYKGAQMPGAVSSVEFAAQVARILRPGGLYAVNVADLPPLAFSRIQAATLRTAFPDVCVVAEAGTLRGRRYGNVVLAAATRPDGLPVDRLAAAARRDPFPARVLHGIDLDRFISGARPMTDADAQDSPAPPPALLT
ncbi:fused MFS/spermidine synthase [Planosporangium thailandense]|uniref:Fused MFS/spermidine synthase n=1 Tax=Planosporangium thailandense TaxID=765197 RepID=A0ABX0Y9P7_9ACTN|nr:fused MFS/spermidine synthase [Planosporangium thailandense]